MRSLSSWVGRPILRPRWAAGRAGPGARGGPPLGWGPGAIPEAGLASRSHGLFFPSRPQPHQPDKHPVGLVPTHHGARHSAVSWIAYLEREREVLHLSSPKADSGAARTSPGGSQKMKQCASIQRETSL